MRDLPYTPNNETPKSIRRWRRVSAGNGDVHLLWNVPVGVPGRMFAFGQPVVEGERAGDGDGDQDGDDSGKDGITSGRTIDSM